VAPKDLCSSGSSAVANEYKNSLMLAFYGG
jgi:hypothetical protein